MKKFLAMVMTVAMVISMMTVVSFAAAEPTFALTSAEANPGEEVTITLSIANNPGITALQVGISWDPALVSLTAKTDHKLFGSKGTFTGGYTVQPHNYNWSDDEYDFTDNGDLATFTFKVAETAVAGTQIPITVSYKPSNVYNAAMDDVTFATSNGAITVKKAGPSYTDGYYDLKTTAENKASVSYFGTVDAATLYVATYKDLGKGYELVGVATKDIAAGTVAELTTVTTDAVAGGDVIKAFLWDANLNTVTWSVLPE